MQQTLMEMCRALGRIEARQEHFVDQMRDHRNWTRKELHDVRRDISTLKRARARPPALELLAKRALTWLLPLLTLWGTGSIDAALKVLEAMR
jgi:transposase